MSKAFKNYFLVLFLALFATTPVVAMNSSNNTDPSQIDNLSSDESDDEEEGTTIPLHIMEEIMRFLLCSKEEIGRETIRPNFGNRFDNINPKIRTTYVPTIAILSCVSKDFKSVIDATCRRFAPLTMKEIARLEQPALYLILRVMDRKEYESSPTLTLKNLKTIDKANQTIMKMYCEGHNTPRRRHRRNRGTSQPRTRTPSVTFKEFGESSFCQALSKLQSLCIKKEQALNKHNIFLLKEPHTPHPLRNLILGGYQNGRWIPDREEVIQQETRYWHAGNPERGFIINHQQMLTHLQMLNKLMETNDIEAINVGIKEYLTSLEPGAKIAPLWLIKVYDKYRKEGKTPARELRKHLEFLLTLVRRSLSDTAPGLIKLMLVKVFNDCDLETIEVVTLIYKKSIGKKHSNFTLIPNFCGENTPIAEAAIKTADDKKVMFCLENFETDSQALQNALQKNRYRYRNEKNTLKRLELFSQKCPNKMKQRSVMDKLFHENVMAKDVNFIREYLRVSRDSISEEAAKTAFFNEATDAASCHKKLLVLVEEFDGIIDDDLAFEALMKTIQDRRNKFRAKRKNCVEVVKILLEHFRFLQDQLRQALAAANHEDIKAVIRGEIRGGGGEQGNKQEDEEFIL